MTRRRWGFFSKYVEVMTPDGLRDVASVWLYVNRYYRWPWTLWMDIKTLRR